MGIIELLTKTRNEQIEEVKNEVKIEGIKNALETKELSIEVIARIFNVDVDFVLEIQKNIKP